MRLFVVLAACLVLANASYDSRRPSKPNPWAQKGKQYQQEAESFWSKAWPSIKLLGAPRFFNQVEDYLNVCQEPYREYEVQQDVLKNLRGSQKHFSMHTQASSSDDSEMVIDAFQTCQRKLPDHLAAIEGAVYAIANFSTNGPKPDEQCIQPIQEQLELTHASLIEVEKETTNAAEHIQERTGNDRLVQIQSALSQLVNVVKQFIDSPKEERIQLVLSQCRDIRPLKRMQQTRDALKTLYFNLKDESEETQTNAIEAVTGLIFQATELHAICHGVEHYESSDRTQEYVLQSDIERVQKIFDQVKTMVKKIEQGSRWFY